MGRANHTIVAIATPPGRGGIGVVRLSGPEAVGILRRLLHATPADLQSHHLHHGWLPDPDHRSRVLDEVLYAFMEAPRTYTGEDVVEIHAHGSPLVLSAIVRAALDAGALPAEPGEFTKRAFLNGRMDLTQAEAVVDLINAQTDRALRTAANQLRGETRDACVALRETYADLLAETEAWIDFPEEDLPDQDLRRVAGSLEASIERLELWLCTWREGHALQGGVRVALVGRPNAGKSSLLNRLAGEERAIVAPQPGTTRDFLEVPIACEGFPVTLVDTAGIRPTADALEDEGVRRSRDQIARADWVLVLVDGSVPPTAEDRALWAEIDPLRRLLVRTKADLPAAWDAAAWDLPSRDVVVTSATQAHGADPLRARLAERIGGAGHEASDVVITSLRQREAVHAAAQAARRALGHLAGGAPPLDLLAADLREALDRLGDLVGRVDAEGILDRVFSRFCIGK